MQPNNKNINNTHKKPRRRKRRKNSKNNNKSTKRCNTHQNPSNKELSYTSQETQSSVPNSSHSTSSNMSFSSFISNKNEQKMEENSQNDIVSGENIHQNLSKSELKNIWIVEKKICFVRGLPSHLCNQSTLASSIWFGGYPGLIKIKINIDKKHAHIIYDNESSAQRAIQFAKQENLHANSGTKRYCDAFIETGYCGKYYCTYAHEWCKPEEVVSIESLYTKPKGPYSIKPSVGTDLMKRYEQEIEDWKNKCRNLKIDVKEWQIKYDNLNDKYGKLKCKLNEISNGKSINIYKYKTWNCEQVYQWIIWNGNYDGYFRQFATETFYKNFKLEDIDGSCLPRLGEEDIYRMGITNFKAKKLLMESIKKLIEKTATTCDGSNGEYMDQIGS